MLNQCTLWSQVSPKMKMSCSLAIGEGTYSEERMKVPRLLDFPAEGPGAYGQDCRKCHPTKPLSPVPGRILEVSPQRY